MIRKIVILIYFLSFSVIGFSQIERPDKAYGIFDVQVVQTDSGVYMYTYDLKNSQNSEQVLELFKIYIEDESLFSAKIPSPQNKKWLIDGLAKQFITGAAASRFIDLPPVNGLAPNESITFSFPSKGLPAIHFALTKGYIQSLTSVIIDSLFNEGFTENQILIDWKEFAPKTNTVSPKVWPQKFDIDVFLDSLETYRQRSCEELGWANDPQFCATLESRLSDVRSSLSAGDSLAAAGALSEFINLVESEKEASLSSEGYALLFFNGQYLWERLQGKP